MEELMRRNIGLGIAQSPASYVDSLGNVVMDGHFSSLSLVESLQQDYALEAIEHIEGMSHRAQRQLQRALGATTLVQFAHCCASRILIHEPLTVAEALASLLEDPARAATMGAAGAEWVAEGFTWPARTSQLRELLARVVG
jgi:glycosyltransferase involved in cell wall biosynthesis